MTDKQQPEALRLANVCSNLTRYSMDAHLIAAYLRSQHAELETLRAKLKVYEDLGGAADDVQLLRMGYAASCLRLHDSKEAVMGFARDIAKTDELAAKMVAKIDQAKEQTP